MRAIVPPGEVSAEQSARFDKLHEEAEKLESSFAAPEGNDAKRAAEAFKVLFANVRRIGRSPREVTELCAPVAA
jgi:hypothetical protein